MAEQKTTTEKRTPRPCPVCKKMSLAKYFPFCSQRCSNLDLHRWLNGVYGIPSAEPADFGDDVEFDRAERGAGDATGSGKEA